MTTPTTKSTQRTTSNSGADIVTNLSNLLPTGTFLAFQALAPLFTNNGDCAGVERIMTSLLIGLFEFLCFFSNFTDSITTSDHTIYYGIVTNKGLLNPRFKGSGLQGVDGMFYDDGTGKYLVNFYDLINGILNVVTFSALSLLTAPITTCFYPTLSSTILKTVPILIGILVGMYFSFAPHARHGIGFALLGGQVGLVSADQEALTTTSKSFKLPAHDKTRLLEKESSVKRSHENPAFELSPMHSTHSSPLHRSPSRGSTLSSLFQLSPHGPNRGTAASPGSSQIP